MRWKETLLPLGFLLITLGSILLLFSSGMPEGSVFFFFPFLIGGSGALGLGLLIALVFILIIVMTRMMPISASDIEGQFDTTTPNSFIPIGSRCEHCSGPIPVDSSFCPSCGRHVRQDEEPDENF